MAAYISKYWVLTEAQSLMLAKLYPNLPWGSALNAWLDRGFVRRELAAKDALIAAEKAEREEQSWRLGRREYYVPTDDSYRKVVSYTSLVTEGWYDEEWDEWVPSETQGVPVDGETRRIVSDGATVSPYRLADGIAALIVGLCEGLALRTRARFTRWAKLQLDAALYPEAKRRDAEIVFTSSEYDDEAATLAWLHRDQDDAAILRRWNRPEDELEFSDLIHELELEDEWVELMTEFRRVKLHATLKEYFGLDDIRSSQIVLKWDVKRRKLKSGEWKDVYIPVEQIGVLDWIERSVAYAGSRLGGYQSCTQSLIEKAKRRGKRVAVTVDREQMHAILGRAGIELYDALYFEEEEEVTA